MKQIKASFAPHMSLYTSFAPKRKRDIIMALTGIVVANLAHELRRELLNGGSPRSHSRKRTNFFNGQDTRRTKRLVFVCKRLPPTHIFNRIQQTKSDDCAEFLYASQKAYCKRTDRRYRQPKAGTDPDLYDRTPRRNGRLMSERSCDGGHGQTQ